MKKRRPNGWGSYVALGLQESDEVNTVNIPFRQNVSRCPAVRTQGGRVSAGVNLVGRDDPGRGVGEELGPVSSGALALRGVGLCAVRETASAGWRFAEVGLWAEVLYAFLWMLGLGSFDAYVPDALSVGKFDGIAIYGASDLIDVFCKPCQRQNEDEAEEGRLPTRVHRGRERIRKLVDKKKRFAKECGRPFCEVCGSDFEKTYGEGGEVLSKGWSAG